MSVHQGSQGGPDTATGEAESKSHGGRVEARNLKDLEEGRQHPELDGKYLAKAICQGDGFLVWLDKKCELKYEIRVKDYRGGSWPDGMAEFEVELAPLWAASTGHFSRSQKVQYHTLAGTAIGIMLDDGSLSNAVKALASARQYYVDRTAEIFRFRYLGTSLAVVLLTLAAGLVVSIQTAWLSQWVPSALLELVAVATLGSVGAFVSIALRLEDIRVSSVSSLHLLVLEAFSRVAVGAVAAALVVAAFRDGLILAPLQQATSIKYVPGVLAVVAGLSERTIPSLAKTLREDTPLESGAKGGT